MTLESTIIDSVLLMLIGIFTVVAYKQKTSVFKQKLLPALMVLTVNLLIGIHALLGINDTDYGE